MPAPPAPRAPGTAVGRRLLLVLGVVAVGPLAVCQRLGLCPRSFSSTAPRTRTGRSAGAPWMQRLLRIARRETREPRTEYLSESRERFRQMESHAAAKMRLKAVLRRAAEAKPEDLDRLVAELEAQSPIKNKDKPHLPDGNWRILGSNAPESLDPTFGFYEGGCFLYEGSMLNGALFSAIAHAEGAGTRVSNLSVKIDGELMTTSATISSESGRSLTASYSARLEPSTGGFLQHRVTSLELPGPVGIRKPLLELLSNIKATYVDDEMTILRDSSWQYEVLVRDPEDTSPQNIYSRTLAVRSTKSV